MKESNKQKLSLSQLFVQLIQISIQIIMSRTRQHEFEIGEGTVFSYIREGYWNILSSYCQSQYKRNGDPFFIFWKAYALHNLSNTNAAINQLLSIQGKKEISYACIVALMFYHNQARNVDREQLDSLRTRQRQQRRSGADKAFVQAIYFYTYLGQYRKAADLIGQKDNSSQLYKMARIWLNLLNVQQQDKQKLEKQIDEFYLEKDKIAPKIQLFMAKNYIKNLQRKFEEALDTLNEGIVFYANFPPFLTEKLVCLMSLGQWEQFHQTALEVSQRDSSNIPAAKALAFYQLARQGNVDNAFMKIKQLQELVQKREANNPKLLFQFSHLFLRICGRRERIIQLLQRIIEKCRKTDPLNADYAIQLGHQLLILGNVSQANKVYQQASSLDQSKIQAITGMIQCKLLQEDIDDAESQLQFVNVMTQTVGRTPTIAYLQAMLTIRKPNQTNQSIAEFYKILDGALKLQIAFSKTLTSGFSYYSKLNPNFLYSIAQLYLRPISMKQMLQGAQNSNPAGPIGKGIKLLESITRQIPGFLPAYLLLAKGKLAVGNQIDASVSIAKVLEIDPRNQEGYIIEAMIKNKKKDYQAAFNSLQEAISHNFHIRQNPLFMLLKGQIQYEMNDFLAAQETMQQAMSLSAVKKKVSLSQDKKFKVISFSEKDRCSIYLLYAKTLMKNKKMKQSKSIMTQAISQFAGTNEQMHVLLTNAFIAIETNDIKKAMSILRAVKNDSLYFVESRKMLADIHLKYLKSRKGYARCYYEIIDCNPTFENYKVYGDALVKINQPQEASVAYEKAYEEKPDNQTIIRDLGRAYSLAHDYDKAIKFYESNIEKLQRPDLILDLAKLCIQLKRFERAQQLLSDKIFSEQTGTYEKLKQNVDAHFQAYKLYLKKQGQFNYQPSEQAKSAMKKAINFQKLVLQKLRSQGGPVQLQRISLGDLYYQISKYVNDYEKNSETAKAMLKECIKINQQHQKALQLLGDLYLRSGQFDKSQSTCEVLLKINPKNDQAGSILAELLLKQNQYDRAIEQFRRILDQSPDKYPVLAKLIDFFRRNNQLTQAKTYIQNAQNKASNMNDAGLCFCRGLYHKYSRNPAQALVQFNKAKKSNQYSQSSLTHMIDIFLCPDQDVYFSALDNKVKQVHPENLRICQSLLRQMEKKSSYHRFVSMEALVIMISGKIKNIEEIINKLNTVLSVRNDYPPALLSLAIAKFLVKKDVQANNCLKICDKITYQPQFGQELEKAWLLHAQSYIQIKKFDNAQDLLRMLLKQNKSCGKAEQLMGLIREKQQSYADAADFYEKAFQLTSRKSASIGYRLAYNYMKAKRYVDCLEVCRQVMQVNPNYTPIKIDIQEKVVQMIR